MNEQNEAILHQVIALANARKLDEAFEHYASDYQYHGPGGSELRGRDGIRGMWEQFIAGFPDMRASIDDLISDGDKVAMRWRVEGTHKGNFMGIPPSNNRMTLHVNELFRIENGQLAEAWDQFDQLDLMQQIGAFPESD